MRVIVPSPIGSLLLEGDETGVRAVSRRSGAAVGKGKPAAVLRVRAEELREYFAGTRKGFSVSLSHTAGTPFQRKVWKALLRIPYGATRTYGDIAQQIGHPKAVRAVGTAVGRNPMPIIIPCHRVVPSSGGIGKFGWGVSAKKTLLELEGAL